MFVKSNSVKITTSGTLKKRQGIAETMSPSEVPEIVIFWPFEDKFDITNFMAAFYV